MLAVVIAIPSVATVWFSWVIWSERRLHRKVNHRECIKNIERLERELFPEWFPKPKPFVQIQSSPYELSRARWIVDDASDIQQLTAQQHLHRAQAMIGQ